jgi:phosphoketolase
MRSGPHSTIPNCDHAVHVALPGAVEDCDTQVLGRFLRDVTKLNSGERNFRIFGPDETLSNLLGAVFEVTNRQWEPAKPQLRQCRGGRQARASAMAHYGCRGSALHRRHRHLAVGKQ